jgi:hypothetical protein
MNRWPSSIQSVSTVYPRFDATANERRAGYSRLVIDVPDNIAEGVHPGQAVVLEFDERVPEHTVNVDSTRFDSLVAIANEDSTDPSKLVADMIDVYLDGRA